LDGGGPSEDHLHGLIIVSLDFTIRHPAVALGRCDPAMAEKVLYGDQFSIGIEHLGGHGMAQMMTGGLESGLSPVIFHPFLNASNRERLTSVESLVIQENPVDLGEGSCLQILNKPPCSIITHVNDPGFSPFGIMDDESLSSEVNGIEGEVCHLTDPHATAKHEQEHGPIPGVFDETEQSVELFVSHMPGERFWHSEAIALSDRVNHGKLLFLNQVVVELPDPLEVAVDGLWFETSFHEEVDIV